MANSNEKSLLMVEALLEARIRLSEGGVPIGCVLVQHGEVIARGHNRRIQRQLFYMPKWIALSNVFWCNSSVRYSVCRNR